MLPDFVIAGAAKAGSSSLYAVLREEPHIAMTLVKEPAFFTNDAIYEKGPEHYRSFFPRNVKGKVTGECTVELMVHETGLRRLKAANPEVKLVFLLKNPATRAISHLYHRQRYDDVFNVDILDESAFHINYSLYGKHLQKVLSEFDRSQVAVFFLEEALSEPEVFFEQLALFLDVDISASAFPHMNQGGEPRSKLLQKLDTRLVRSGVANYFPNGIRQKLSSLRDRLRSINTTPRGVSSTDELDQLRVFFQPDLALLQQVLGRQVPSSYLMDNR